MSSLKLKLAFLNSQPELEKKLNFFEPHILSAADLKTKSQPIEILIVQAAHTQLDQISQLIRQKKLKSEISKIILTFENQTALNLKTTDYNLLHPDFVVESQKLTADFLHQIWFDISQSEQDESYLNLSTELNSQYEIIKLELEKRLQEKTKNLIESRQQISEISHRLEFLRKTLYVTSKVKNLEQAEVELNELLAQQNKVTWLKIIQKKDELQFETDLGVEFKSTFFKNEIQINQQSYLIYFFKAEKKAFKKIDTDYFKKLTETLQINLSRYDHLLSLQQSERLFDLAFHSSPHYIMVIDQNYQVLQANLAIEKVIKENSDKTKCFELLFNRTSPCAGCKLGDKFQIQNELQTFRVQSNSFNLNEDDDTSYWIHLYEDISEQISLENKFQQSARLAELGLVSSSIAHELNNPLGGIISYIQIMKMELPQTHPFQTDLEMMNQTALRMKKIIEDLLIFSRKENILQFENVSLYQMLLKNLELLQMQLKKENLKVSIKEPETELTHSISNLHFRNSIHLVFQYFLQKLKVKKLNQSNYTGLVEVKIFQDQINSYLSFSANLGPYDAQANTNDLTLMTLEKSLLDQGFQVVISEALPGWVQILITLIKKS